MFTGIIEELGTISSLTADDESCVVEIKAAKVLQDIALGDSIAVEGVCLTVTSFTPERFTVSLALETRRRTSLEQLSPGSKVNLERALTPTSRMGGHYVQGHVDATGTITNFRKDGDALWITIQTPPALMRYIVTKGYICIDGTSLTVVDVGVDWFTVTLIAYTQAHITLPAKQIGASVNLEVDIIAKYVERLVAPVKEPI